MVKKIQRKKHQTNSKVIGLQVCQNENGEFCWIYRVYQASFQCTVIDELNIIKWMALTLFAAFSPHFVLFETSFCPADRPTFISTCGEIIERIYQSVILRFTQRRASYLLSSTTVVVVAVVVKWFQLKHVWIEN